MDDNRYKYQLEKQTRTAALVSVGLGIINTLIIFSFAFIQMRMTTK